MKERIWIAVLVCFVLASVRSAALPVSSDHPRIVSLTETGTATDAASVWEKSRVKAIDGAGDVAFGFEGADILAFYFDERPDELAFRVSMVQMKSTVSGIDLFEREQTELVVLLDYAGGGRSDLPGATDGESSLLWEEAVVLCPFARAGEPRAGILCAASPEPYNPLLHRAFVHTGGEYLEAGMSLSPVYRGISAEIVRRASMAGAQDPTGVKERELIAAHDLTPIRFEVVSLSRGMVIDRLTADNLQPSGETNCAFVHHGNQGLAYSDVFYGRSDDPDGSGFDEALQVHEATSVPGNFHLCPLLQTSQKWDHNNGDPMDFNGWLASGVSAGWCGMITSAYGQHIMPFVQDDMNDWSVHVETQMTDTRYGYYPRVAWVPERVWLHPSFYPNAGVSDDVSDNWGSHGVWGVILDDDVHGQGYDNHQIHTLAGGSGLKVLLRDRNFTGKIVGGDGAGALQILENLANSGAGEYRIAIFAEDWEAVAEMGSWAGATPYAKETYDWFINKCSAESAWLHTWKLADAVTNPDFQGSTSMNVTYGAYWEIGGTGGYGGGNNGWYTDWAGYVPYANGGDGNGACDPGRGGNCKNHGTLWYEAYAALMATPGNNISQAGWYVLMTNLHETGWHDGMGGPISGWQLNYSGHIKNAAMFAEASHWANGEYANQTGAYYSDIDNDGYNELVMHNDRVFAVFEGIGARATNVFAKGTDYNFSIIGVDNAYWSGTQADYNDVNHVGALSDVGPNYQHSLYDMQIHSASGTTVEAVFTHQDLVKRVRLTTGQPYLDVIYEVGPSIQYIKSGYSPGLVDLIWNAQMDRIWVGDIAYVGQRNPNNGATAALVLGGGGASHNFDFSARIMKGDEIYGEGTFEFLLYAGTTAAPDTSGEITELRTLAGALTDTIGPGVVSAVYYPGTDKLRINFNQVAQYAAFVVTGVSVDDDDDGVPELTLSSGTTVVETSDGYSLTLALTAPDASALEDLDTSGLELMMAANTAYDQTGNGNEAITNEDDRKISYGAETMITIDGYIDTAEWDMCTFAVPDSNDSEWTAANELDGIYVTWDSLYLYIAVDGIVHGNSWLLYVDVDPGGPGGEADLSAIDTWERGTVFTFPGFKCDFQYGCYQHQGQWDSDSFFKILSATTTASYSDSIVSAFDATHDNGDRGGSELAIPWNVLYGLGPGAVPQNASFSIVASLCWDPEPDGVLGGDSAPSNISASLPTVDNACTFAVDGGGDGRPDLPDRTPPELVNARRGQLCDSLVYVTFSEPVDSVTAEMLGSYTVYETGYPMNTVAVVSAELCCDQVTALLILEHGIGDGYTLSVSFVADLSCYRNVIEPGSTIAITESFTGDEERVVRFPGALCQNFPNPFNPSTVIRFEVPGTLPAGGTLGATDGPQVPVFCAVYDVSGRLVRMLIDCSMTPGVHDVTWDGANGQGVGVSSGIYFYRIVSGGWSETKKMVLLR